MTDLWGREEQGEPLHIYKSERATLYCGDARDILAKLEPRSAGLIVADPPYGVDWQSGNRDVAFSKIEGDDGSLDVIGILASYQQKVLQTYRHLYCFGFSHEKLREALQFGGSCDLIWDKTQPGLGDLALPWGPQHEVIGFGVWVPSKKNRTTGYGDLTARLRSGSVLRVPRFTGLGSKYKQHHPTEKPVELLRRLIESSSQAEEVVLDMFMGTGATGVAALLSGRKFVGVELDPGYFQIAVQRIKRAEELWAEMLAI